MRKFLNNRSVLIKFNICFLILLFFTLLSCQSIQGSNGWDAVPDILKQIKPPVFPNQDFMITDYGAIADGKILCTKAIGEAIEACVEAGGGRVVVPKGTFLTGAIHLKSNVNLHLDEGSTLLFSQNLDDYKPLVYTRFEGVECMNYSPFIYAFEQENIAITGSGTLDGSADNSHWWHWKGQNRFGWKKGDPNQAEDRDVLFQMAEDGVPVHERVFGDGHYLRVNFVQPYRCKNVLIEGVTVKRSPMWEIHLVLCENITVQNITVISHGPNNDGCNPESSKYVLIKDCYFDTGDDCIAIKSGRNADGRRINEASEKIVIQGCTMKDGHGGVVIGSEISGNCRYVYAEDCIMDSPNLDRALRIKTNSLRGGIVENIYMRNITIGEVSDAVIRINFHYEKGDVGEFTPSVRNIHVQNATSKKSKYALLLDGYARSPITNIFLENCRFEGVMNSNIIRHVEKLTMKEVYINSKLQH